MSLSASKSIKSSINAVFNSVRVDEDGRERWSSRVAFYFAAVGSVSAFCLLFRYNIDIQELTLIVPLAGRWIWECLAFPSVGVRVWRW